MADLTAASYDDVVAFFKKYYAPANASLVVAGDIDTDDARKLVEKWFGDVKAGAPVEPITIPGADADRRAEEDASPTRAAAAALPGLAHAARISRPATRRSTSSPTCWPAARTRASTSGSSTTCRSRRTCRRFRARRRSRRSFLIEATPRPGHTVDGAAEGHRRGDREAAARAADRARGPARAQPDRGVVLQPDGARRRLRRQGRSAERVLHRTGDPDWFNEDLARYRALSPSDISGRRRAVPAGATAASN